MKSVSAIVTAILAVISEINSRNDLPNEEIRTLNLFAAAFIPALENGADIPAVWDVLEQVRKGLFEHQSQIVVDTDLEIDFPGLWFRNDPKRDRVLSVEKYTGNYIPDMKSGYIFRLNKFHDGICYNVLGMGFTGFVKAMGPQMYIIADPCYLNADYLEKHQVDSLYLPEDGTYYLHCPGIDRDMVVISDTAHLVIVPDNIGKEAHKSFFNQDSFMSTEMIELDHVPHFDHRDGNRVYLK